MSVDVRTPRGSAVTLEPACIAAIVVALRAVRMRRLVTPQRRNELDAHARWRSAGRAYDTYEHERRAADAKRAR